MEKNNSGGGAAGVLSVVGTGPGSLDYLIPAARKELEHADVVVGYKTYLSLIEPLIEDKIIIASAMMQEVERVKQALAQAEQGQRVVLVSGGDPGIYAMAGLVYEVAEMMKTSVEVRVVAGIAALNSCAERLGAPLMHDFAAVSLSDLLTPWDVIEKRIRAAVEADFVLVMYNPRSRKRDWQLARALEIVASFRRRETPVGMVRGATRDNEKIIVATLETFNPEEADMQSTIIIGNSKSRITNGKMVTPRGYGDKYRLS
ncbi:MAG: precorrin-3B C(17)-methyltransferase [Desulfofustis sp.]|jgi:precorrin-3B C17-methyltransferase